MKDEIFSRTFGNTHVVVRYVDDKINRIDVVYKYRHNSIFTFFSVGYILKEKHVLCSGFPSRIPFYEVKTASESMFEATSVFDNELSKDILKTMGYKSMEKSEYLYSL